MRIKNRIWLILLFFWVNTVLAASEVPVTKTMSDAEWVVLAEKHNCRFCHEKGSDSLGPSLKEIALEYSANPEAEEILLKRISNGSIGNWGDVMMPPQISATNHDEIRALVRFILKQK
jgi:cytochrome c